MNSNSIRRSPVTRLALLAGAGLVALAGCSSGGGVYGGGQSQGAASAPRADTTVTVATVSGRQILETANGRALYVNDEEDGKIVGTSHAFTTVWIPLLTAGRPLAQLTCLKSPEGSPPSSARTAPPRSRWTASRSDTFEFDHGPGQVTGDGAKDSFDGTSFTWHRRDGGRHRGTRRHLRRRQLVQLLRTRARHTRARLSPEARTPGLARCGSTTIRFEQGEWTACPSVPGP